MLLFIQQKIIGRCDWFLSLQQPIAGTKVYLLAKRWIHRQDPWNLRLGKGELFLSIEFILGCTIAIFCMTIWYDVSNCFLKISFSEYSSFFESEKVIFIFPLEFFLNKFPRIQWIMTKSKSGMVTKGITHLATNTLPVLLLGTYPLQLTTLNRCQPTVSSGKFLFTTTSRNESIVRWRMSLVTILFLDFVIIYWICWIQGKSFRESSILEC